MSAKTKILTTSGKVTSINADGTVTKSGPVTVRLIPESTDSCAAIQIYAAYHRADECVIGSRTVSIGTTTITW